MAAVSHQHRGYIGRFAPSPTGPLHFGSLVAAVASYLDARAHQGQWLLRIEDLDPPREVAGASEAILASLEAHGLLWDGEILFQSQRANAYANALAHLDASKLVYPCYCNRKSVMATGGIYPGTCRPSGEAGSALDTAAHSASPSAIRVKTRSLPLPFASIAGDIHFDDLIFGPQYFNLPVSTGDYILRRKDGLFAYQLAVVVDDMAQQVSHVIRGSDLLDSSAQQIFLFKLLQAPPPVYGHVPVVLNPERQKLSKQQGAAPLDNSRAANNLCRALQFLGQGVPDQLLEASCATILEGAIARWDRRKIPRRRGLIESAGSAL